MFRCNPQARNILLFLRKSHTFDNQNALPRLPIPSLNNLKDKYLKSLEPLLEPSELEKSKAIVTEFLSEGGFGQDLQNRLIEFDKGEKNSWLENFWLQKAYLEWREPSLINVNWWCEFIDHPQHPKDILVKRPPLGVITSFQIKRAAGLITNMLNFNNLLNTQQLPPEYLKTTPICMNQYKNIFGTTRIPGKTSDFLVNQYPTIATHIIVMIKNQIFKVDVLGKNQERVSVAEIERLLTAVSKEALSTPPEPAVGLLTAGHRDTNYKGYSALKKLSSNNTKNFDIIKNALFSVSLDDSCAKKNLDHSHLKVFHGGNAENRWFDKAIQLVVTNNGRSGINGEHSPCDAVVPGKMVDYIIQSEPAVDPSNCTDQLLDYPQKLKWDIDENIESLIQESQKTAVALIEDTESCLLQTDVYGFRFMKEVAKTSPDAYVQIALQLAYYRLHKSVTAVYESASARVFKHGRTETGRSLSNESLAFCKAFDDDNILYDDKRTLFAKAIKTQSNYMKEAAFGNGIDRHMLGLRCMIKPNEMEKATMFTDSAYMKSMYFKLSTSNMSPGTNFWGGFGPVVPDGYGINYAIGKDDLKFSISSKKSCPSTNSFKFREVLERTLIDMSEVWGRDWKGKHELEKKEAYQLAKMKALSEKLKKDHDKRGSRISYEP